MAKNRDNSVGTASGFGLEAGVRFLTGVRDFSVLQTGSGAHPASHEMGTGGSFLQGKAAGACSHSELVNIFDEIPY
jgi:hypothetical protein